MLLFRSWPLFNIAKKKSPGNHHPASSFPTPEKLFGFMRPLHQAGVANFGHCVPRSGSGRSKRTNRTRFDIAWIGVDGFPVEIRHEGGDWGDY